MDDAALSVSEPPARDWSLLPLDVLALIFHRTGVVDVLMGAGLACRSWLEAAKLPELWRVVDMDKHNVVFRKDDDVLCAMAKVAVDRSDGQLRSFAGKLFVNDELMEYIVERSPLLTNLRLVSCRDLFLGSVMPESPLPELRSLQLYDIKLTVEDLTAFLHGCPLLELLWMRDCFRIDEEDEHALRAKFSRIKTLTLRDGVCRYCSLCQQLRLRLLSGF